MASILHIPLADHTIVGHREIVDHNEIVDGHKETEAVHRETVAAHKVTVDNLAEVVETQNVEVVEAG